MVELALTYTDAVQLDMDMATRSKLWALGIEQRRTGDIQTNRQALAKGNKYKV